MVSQIDQAFCLWPQLLGKQKGTAPILHNARIEIWFVRLVLGKKLPIFRKMTVDLAETFQRSFKSISEILLTWEIGAIRQPNGYCIGTQFLSAINHLDVVLNCLFPYVTINMAK